ncbi:HET domain containing protein [Hyaloscypha variabilis]
MPLCQACEKFDIYSLWIRPRGSYALRLDDVLSAASQCDFCSLLCEQFEVQLAKITRIAPCRIWLSLHSEIDDGGVSSRFKFTSLFVRLVDVAEERYQRPEEVQLQIVASRDSAAARSGHFVGRYLGNDPRSPHHFAAIKTWLDDCLEHPACKAQLPGIGTIDARKSPLPTRCVELAEDHGFLLADTRNKVGSYITLSHRWNNETPSASTTLSNLEERSKGRGWETLPRTFLDAIEVARQLGIQYVWIDSICIIQSGDGGRDWTTEATKMAAYYQNSLLTVAAVDNSKEHGFLGLRAKDAAFKRLVRLPYFEAGGVERGQVFVFKPEFDASQSHYGTYARGLLTRGWVFQEWLLSRRVVYFAKDQLVFECQSRRPKNESNEVIFGEESSRFNRYWSVLKMRYAIRGAGRKGSSGGVSAAFTDWYGLIEKYCQQEFTHQDKDYLIAASGMACAFRDLLATITNKGASTTHISLEYVSGLWLEDIHFALLWQVADRAEAESGSACSFDAPSWSWCSLSLRIIWLSRRPRTRKELHILGTITREGEARPIDRGVTVSPEQGQSEHLQQYRGPVEREQEQEQGIDTDITMWSRLALRSLLVRGRLIPVLVGNYTSQSDLHSIKVATGHEKKPGRLEQYNHRYDFDYSTPVLVTEVSASWRIVVSLQEPEIIAGYGSFERPHVQDQLAKNERTVALALHISTTEGVGYGADNGYSARILGLGTSVYNVLFLENRGGGKYSRLGVGCIFDERLKRILKSTEEEAIELV